MDEVLIIGHKNPDADAICSAFSYAYLKNELDKSRKYVPARCGSLNKQTRYIFDRFQIETPEFVSDIFLKVKDIMTKDVFYVRENDPLWLVLKSINDMKIRLVPIVNKDNVFLGVVSVPEIASFFSQLEGNIKPKYLVKPENFPKVIPGYFIKSSENEEFMSYFLVGAMPFDTFKDKLGEFNPKDVVLVVGDRVDLIDYAKQQGVSAIVLTGLKDASHLSFDDFDGWVYVSTKDTAETLRLLALSVPSKLIMGESQTAKEDDYVEDVKSMLSSDYHRGVPVVAEDGKLKGILTRSDFLSRNKKKVILVDHNEFSQAVEGIEEAEVVEIIDHHRLGNIKTDLPIYIYAKPAGSSCTLVYQLFKFNDTAIPESIASTLLSGILSDTVVLKSPTTTKEDIDAAEELSSISKLDIEELGEDIFDVTESLLDRKIVDIIESDFKVYNESSVYFGIGQAEVVNLREIDKIESELLKEMESKRVLKGLDWLMLLVTDILSRNSILLSISTKKFENRLGFSKINNNKFYLPGVLSRKKQLLPEVLRVLEENA